MEGNSIDDGGQWNRKKAEVLVWLHLSAIIFKGCQLTKNGHEKYSGYCKIKQYKIIIIQGHNL